MERIRAGSIDLMVDVRGEGVPLVLIMGIGAQLVHWPAELCDMIAARGVQVIRFDNRDSGLSSRFDGAGLPPVVRTTLLGLLGVRPEATYTLRDMADDVRNLLDALELESAHVCGISMGGMIAQEFVLAHRERARSLISMSSSPNRRFYPKPRALKALLGRKPYTREQAVNEGVELMRALRSTGWPFPEQELREFMSAAIERAFSPCGFARQLNAIAATPARVRRLRALDLPTLVIHGDVDPLIPLSQGKATAKAIPNARLEVLAGLGHDLPRQLWPRFTDLICAHVFAQEPAGVPAS